MKTKIRQAIPVFLIMIIAFSCYEPYQPRGIDNDASYLVVDGSVNSSEGSATVTLSRTTSLASTDSTINSIDNASVMLLDESGVAEKLSFSGRGIYTATGLAIRAGKKYKITIISSGKTYESDLESIQSTPPIDSVIWSIDNDKLDIKVSTHSNTGSERYYRWKFTETWEYQAPYQSAFILRNDSVIARKEGIRVCWRSAQSQKISIYSTDYLANDVVSNFTVQSIPANSLKLSNRYSILVKQQTLTKKAYTYWTNLKKTTESLGSLTDPLPGAVAGNIRCVANPDERVLGYFSVGGASEKRIFIDIDELTSFVSYKNPYCELTSVDTSAVKQLDNNHEILFPKTDANGVFVGWWVTSPVCADCRKFGGGSTTKPPFWIE